MSMGPYNQIIKWIFKDYKEIRWTLFLKLVYFILLLPGLLFVLAISMEVDSDSERHELGGFRKVWMHISLLFLSFVGWMMIIGILLGTN
jgi:hypothetical protein